MPLLCVIDTKAFAGLVFIGPFCNEIVRAFSLDCDTRHAKEEEEKRKKIFNTHVVSLLYCSNFHTASNLSSENVLQNYYVIYTV